MNHCYRCECDFVQPGTCNCFAPVRLYPYQYPVYPWGTYPVYPYPQPIWISPSYPLSGSGTVTIGTLPETGTTITFTGEEPLKFAGGTVNVNSMQGVSWSYTGTQQ